MLFLVFFVFLFKFYLITSFNLETRIPIIKQGHPGSYFGYSVAEHQSVDRVKNTIENNWLLVGAPLDANLQPGTNRSGALWKCPITTRTDDCQQVITDGKRTVDSKELTPPLDDEIKDGQWMGVTVRSQGSGGKVMVCAHRYVRKGEDFQWGQGLCYTLTQDLDYDETWEPCKGRPTTRAHEQYGFCQAGTSGLLLEDDTALIGTPGPYTWRGTVFVLSVADEYLSRDKTFYYSPLLESEQPPVDKYSYLGMSVTGAKFFGDHVSYAAGAPRSNGTGQVILFKKVKKTSNPMAVELIINGDQFASSFGYEVTNADLNGDRLPDLIIAAPFYFGRESGGAVYIYYNNANGCLTCSPPQKLVGQLESRFGFALSSLGDINLDGIDDLAVGAPYEDSGVVYIYLGSKNGLIKEPSQIIRASQIEGIPKTFGYSLSGKLDLDSNGYPDLLVGAYEDDSVVLLRARPIVDIVTEIKPEQNLRNIDPARKGCDADPNSDLTCFSFEACCFVPNTTTNDLNVHFKIEAETFQNNRKFSRIWFSPDDTLRPHIVQNNITLRRDYTGQLRHCQQVLAYVKESIRDIQSPIRMKLSYSLIQQQPRKPRPGYPVPSLDIFPILNQQEAAKTFDATFQKDCGTNDICESNLVTSAVLLLPQGSRDNIWELVLGTTQDIQLNVTVENRGESAYETLLYVFHSKSLSFIGINTVFKQLSCQPFNKTLVICNIGNPFKSQSLSTVQLRFDPQLLRDDETELLFTVFANSTSNETEIEDPVQLQAIIYKKAEVSIQGSARPEQVFYGGAVRGESAMIFKDDIGSRVVHTYQIYNEGPWRVNNLEIIVKWPFQVANNKPQGKWLLYLDEMPTVDALSGGQCYIPADDVNPLKLDQRPGLFDVQPTEAIQVSSTPDYNYTSTVEQLEEIAPTRTRRKRDTEMIVTAEKVTDEAGRRHTVVNMNCVKGTSKCLKFKCVINILQKQQVATVRISARLWNSTLVEDYPRIDYVSISSYAELRLTSPVQQNKSNDVAEATTRAYPELLEGAEPEAVPIWIMIVAIVAGFLLLVFITLVLWKIGFFKRSRPDPTLSANLTKPGEDE